MKASVGVIFAALLSAHPALASPSVQCWGNNGEGQTSVPSDLALTALPAHPLEIHTARGATCVLGDTGKIVCRGIPMADIPKLEALQGVKTFGVSSGGACAIVTSQGSSQVLCFSAMGDQSFEQIPALQKPVALAVAASAACALDDTGVKCWGADNDSSIAQVPELSHPKKVVAGASDFCALDDTGVVCWGDGQLQIEPAPTLAAPKDVFMGSVFACAVDQKGLECWGSGIPGSPSLPQPGPKTQYVAGQNHVCALNPGDRHHPAVVQCFGDNSFSQLEIPPLSNPTRIFADSVGNQTCAVDDTGLNCWGEDQAGQSSLSAVSSISAGYGNTCVTVRGKLECWGTGSKTVNSPLAVSDAYQISLGSNYACAMNVGTSSSTSCWGDNALIPPLSPQLPPQDYTQGGQFSAAPAMMATGFDHACIMNPGQNFACFGNNDFGQTKIPVGLDPVLDSAALTAGGDHTCAIDKKQGVLCWGKNEFGESAVPGTLKNPRQVSAGLSHTCALDEHGVTCWGRGTEGQTKVPPLSHPRIIRAGGYHTCALDDHGLTCWGDNSFGESTIPKSLAHEKIVNVSTGLFHTCVVTQ